MRRREFLTLLGGTAIGTPFAANAQTLDRVKRIGVLSPFAESDADTQAHLALFRSELARLGWTDGREVQIEYRWGAGDPNRIRSSAKELIKLQPDVLLARSTPVTKALLHENPTIPVVFVVVSDPVGDGLVASVARPGGIVTGFTNVEASLGGKWLGLLRDLAPGVSRVAVMFNPKTSPGGGSYYWRLIQDAATSTTIKTVETPVQDAADIRRAIQAFAQEPKGGMVVLPDVLTTGQRELIIKLTAQYKLPAIYAYRYIVTQGGLASYGVDVADLYRRAAGYVDRIIRGDKAGDLPVQAPIKFELAINLRAAKALGLTIPPTLLAIADDVIE
jgi:putative ABC transport system substrate-binding protein